MEVASLQGPSCADGRLLEESRACCVGAGPTAGDGAGFFSELHEGPGLNLIVTGAQLA